MVINPGIKLSGEVISALFLSNAHKATKYVSPKYVIKATRRHKKDHRNNTEEMVITFGIPNYREREFIKMAKKANEPFPVRKIQFSF